LNTPPAAEPLLPFLVGGFVLLLIGIAALTIGRTPVPAFNSPQATRRAALYAVVYGAVTACFMRLVEPALLGEELSPWLLALSDVMFVTIGLFTWVMVLAEGHDLTRYGLRGARFPRFMLATVMGLAVLLVHPFDAYRALFSGSRIVTADSLTFALLFALVGSAFPEEMLFRGYLQGSLDGRARTVIRVAVPALAFTVVRSFRFLPGGGLGEEGWVSYVLGTALPLGIWWGIMREVAGGSIWPCLISHFLHEFGTALASSSPVAPVAS
jgi:membrane protease YdiL (CAAX protease family)